jgi:hypothetical protein
MTLNAAAVALAVVLAPLLLLPLSTTAAEQLPYPVGEVLQRAAHAACYRLPVSRHLQRLPAVETVVSKLSSFILYLFSPLAG